MFQTFETPSTPGASAPRIQALRNLMAKSGLSAFLIPRADEHQGEYVPACAERLRWLTGFSGSAGFAAITLDNAALFVDGRYTVQAAGEVDTSLMAITRTGLPEIAKWLTSHLEEGETVGYDPRLFTIRQIDTLKTALAKAGLKLRPRTRNPIDQIWGADRPAPPSEPVGLHPFRYAGRKAAEKIEQVQEKLKADHDDGVLLTQPDSICWLLNIRGRDIPHNPVVLAHAYVPQRGKPILFIDPAKLDRQTRDALKADARLMKPETLDSQLRSFAQSGKTIRLDPATGSDHFRRLIGSKNLRLAPDPCILPKARKNATEIKSARAVHSLDGAAMVRFLHWLDETAAAAASTSEPVTEIDCVRRLEELRSATGRLREISFDTIAGSGPHGAIVHYRVTEKSNRALRAGELFLIDSGAQYDGGTTDITRTIAIGEPAPEMVRHATLVLKGHIAIATAIFPEGTRGVDLDPFARRALWADGLDYDHGTGHGVGSYLSVHEGPVSISRLGTVPLEPGMILSNEPGYYREGAYGIRLENLVLVTSREQSGKNTRAMLEFETLTLAPFDRNLIDAALLTNDERNWLNTYHQRVLDELGPAIDERPIRDWLKGACAPI